MDKGGFDILRPMFSVIIPLYNKEHYIRFTLDSVLAQKFQDYEVIVINDGSIDNSPAIARSFRDERLRVIDQENGGVSSARNRGAAEANGRWLAFLDGDDIWSIDHLNELSRLVQEFPGSGLVCTTSSEVQVGGDFRFTSPSEGPVRRRIDYFRCASRNIGIVNSSSAAVAVGVFESVGGFSRYTLGEDLEFWAKVALVSGIAKSDKNTVIYLRGTAGAMEAAACGSVAHPRGEAEELTLDNLSPSVSLLVKKLPEITSDRKLYDSVVVYINSRVVSAIRGSFVNGRFERMKKLRQLIITPCDSVDFKWLILARLPRWLLASMFRTRVVARWFYRKLVS